MVWLYGMRGAAQAWEEHFAGKLEAVGFRRGKAAPTVFYHPERGVRLVVHGDDFTFMGVRRQLKWIGGLMKGWYDVKERGIMGSAEGEIKEIVILGRILRWADRWLEYEADPKHREVLVREFGLEGNSKAAGSPGVKEKSEG